MSEKDKKLREQRNVNLEKNDEVHLVRTSEGKQKFYLSFTKEGRSLLEVKTRRQKNSMGHILQGGSPPTDVREARYEGKRPKRKKEEIDA